MNAIPPRAGTYRETEDAALIAAGRARGWTATHLDARTSDPYVESIGWLRFRAACAREEMRRTSDPELVRYLRARATQADNEATKREQVLAEINEREAA